MRTKFTLYRNGLRAAFAASVVLSCAAAKSAYGYTEQTVHLFCSLKNCADGSGPTGVAIDQSGNLYGVASSGGTHGAGLVYEFVPSAKQYTVLYNFCNLSACADGSSPYRVDLVIDTNGNLYGTTAHGGNSTNAGVVFELLHKDARWREKVLYTFGSSRHDAGQPHDGLTYLGAATHQPYDGSSPLYGATVGGGLSAAGTVFSLALKPGTKKWKEQVLYSFCATYDCADGDIPDTPLYLDASGNIYGTTQGGGQYNAGTVFELSPSGSEYAQATLYSFCSQANCVDGDDPLGGVVMDNSGNLIGTAASGGVMGDGVVFQLSPSGSQWQFTVLDNFDGSNGAVPVAGLVVDGAGNYFGTTESGGANRKGTAFEFEGSIITLYSFCPQAGCPDGRVPVAGVVEDANGNLFGAAYNGGNNRRGGTLYELSP